MNTATMVDHSTKNNNKINESNVIKSENKGLNPWFITGYTDGEGSFSVRLRKSATAKWGFNILPVFSIGAQNNSSNKELLDKVKEFFGGIGWISSSGNMYYYEVASLKSLHIIKNHFFNTLLKQVSIFISFYDVI